MAQSPSEMRSRTMRAVKSRDTKPEMIVRRIVHAMGKRYRLHRADLPGKPDLTFPRLKKIIFVHGCFWHGHDCRAGLNKPKSNQEYWVPKLERNLQRDREKQKQLINMGWQILVIWECELKLKHRECLTHKIKSFLDS